MKKLNDISKSTWLLHQSVKDSIEKGVINAAKLGHIKIEPKNLEKLLMVLNASADEGYSVGYKHVMKVIQNSLMSDDQAKTVSKKNSKL